MNNITIIGGGLAGCEAAFQIAIKGLSVRLYEMRPHIMTGAHRSGNLGELVCSSSLKSNSPSTAHGLLKEEMRTMGSIILDCAAKASVPGGDALCVDREKFGKLVTQVIESNPNIEVIRQEITDIPLDRPCVIATGPLTSPALADSIKQLTGANHLHFFDAIAPSVDSESIDYGKCFRQSRYDKGEAAYINCPMTHEEYEAFIDALVGARIANLHLEEEKNARYFEGCLPVEVIAKRGRDTLTFGTMKPVGLTDPHTGRRPHAVVQLRQENADGTVYGLVGFQTQLRQSEQDRVFRMIPGLEHAEFVQYGAVHRNTYIDSPNVLTSALHTKLDKGLFFAGQMVGVEGYMESAASGIVAGINASRIATGQSVVVPPKETIIGALLDYIANCPIDDFQPMNSNFGILPPILEKHPKKMRKELKVERARKAMREFSELSWGSAPNPARDSVS
ncbi:MAG: methylenetetrahydrofolate--tRNA-(uracil(54)-C(5))-methyltransferase (FADH(2)-oxidizing) TrmFO [Armatimonadota bacterium]|nr:methylenetetrahydrofolate--tRNA-(uracil(54)-C(5))-methyltransferase (FADH(2)-oxidizing) TrmFO [bacterium]